MNEKRTTWALWAVYGALLAVLLPHTAWAFSQFEPETTWGRIIGWLAAIAFEFAIAVLTAKLALHISEAPNSKRPLVRFRRFYVNAYAAGLVVAIGVSTLANLAHAVQFGRDMALFARWGIPFGVYAVAFGAILPVVSLLFARVLSNVREDEAEENAELVTANKELTDVRRQLREANRRVEIAERSAAFLLELTAEDKAKRILAIRERWPGLQPAAIAVIAEASKSYVTEVIQR